jgi:hypothetical protein
MNLLRRVQNVQECDATSADSSSIAGNIIIETITEKLLPNFK